MKKIIFCFLLLIITNISNAQFSFVYNPSDSSYTNRGGWSLVPMYSSKDSTANFDSYYFRIFTNSFRVKRLNSTYNDGRPISIVWTAANGDVRRSPIDSIYLSRYYPVTNPNNYISSYTETDPLFNTKFSTKSTSDLVEGTNE